MWWLFWTLLLLLIGAYVMTNKDADRSFFVPGPSINGHYQIEERCDLCHDAFGGVRQKKCLSCHDAELQRVNDSHGRKKFRDPRNSQNIDKINVKKCRVCHIDHKLDNSNKMGVTIANDFCIHCHNDIEKERPTHKDFNFDGCITCHNYHDNSDLNEVYLAKHLDEPKILSNPLVPERDYLAYYNRLGDKKIKSLSAHQHDAPEEYNNEHNFVALWETSSHAKAGVNCGNCHRANTNQPWRRFPPIENCESCHAREVKSFKLSRHGMRTAQKLTPMKTSTARLPMHKNNKHSSLSCNSCHTAHDYKTSQSGLEACMACHDDKHTKNYKDSKHYALVLSERAGKSPKGSGVSCATCHLPRELISSEEKNYVVVQHNQNMNLRPRSKQIKSVCSRCHGLRFSLDSLADDNLMEKNYEGLPVIHLESLDMVKSRMTEKTQEEK